MTIEEIQAALDEIAAAMVEKGLIQPAARYWMESGKGGQCICCWRKDENSAYQNALEVFHGEPSVSIAAARDWVAAIETIESRAMKTYLGKLADAVDFGAANNIAAEYVDPVRITQKAMSDNLLGVSK